MIELQDLTKRFRTTIAVDGVSASIRPGAVTAFLGPNGAGKSTTMRMIAGLDRPTSGAATIDGRRYTDRTAPLHEVGLMLDARSTMPSRRVIDHLRWLAYSNRIPATRIGDVLDLCGIQAVARRRAGTLSLGMAQRLGLAAALLGDPAVLILDEPTNGIDPEGIVWIRGLLRDLAAQGRTVLVSSHLMSEMSQSADRVLVIGRGQLLADCPLAELPARAGLTTTIRARTSQADRLAADLAASGVRVHTAGPDIVLLNGRGTDYVAARAAELGIILTELREQPPSLESAYLTLTASSTDHIGRPADLPKGTT